MDDRTEWDKTTIIYVWYEVLVFKYPEKQETYISTPTNLTLSMDPNPHCWKVALLYNHLEAQRYNRTGRVDYQRP